MNLMSSVHIPVLLQAVLDGLALQGDEIVVDATVNRAGHALKIGQQLSRGGTLIGIDRDDEALAEAKSNLRGLSCRVILINGNFRSIAKLLDEQKVDSVNGILMDIGLSSNQLEESARGFSFQKDEPLLMTFESEPSEEALTAYEIVNSWAEESLADIIYGYGDEKFSRRIAKAIVEARRKQKIETTGQLVKLIEGAVPAWYRRGRIHPATKTFQALRITVNDELGALKEGLSGALSKLAPGGRLLVISFHGLEAKIIKNQFRDWSREGLVKLITKKAIKPTREEVLSNPRSRSAELRIVEKI